MVLTDAIRFSNHRTIFVRCLDSQLRSVLPVSAGLPLPSDSYILSGSASPTGDGGALDSGRAQLPRRVKCANQPPAPMKENIRRGSVSG
jgi:hypothetical protein